MNFVRLVKRRDRNSVHFHLPHMVIRVPCSVDPMHVVIPPAVHSHLCALQLGKIRESDGERWPMYTPCMFKFLGEEGHLSGPEKLDKKCHMLANRSLRLSAGLLCTNAVNGFNKFFGGGGGWANGGD